MGACWSFKNHSCMLPTRSKPDTALALGIQVAGSVWHGGFCVFRRVQGPFNRKDIKV